MGPAFSVPDDTSGRRADEGFVGDDASAAKTRQTDPARFCQVL